MAPPPLRGTGLPELPPDVLLRIVDMTWDTIMQQNKARLRLESCCKALRLALGHLVWPAIDLPCLKAVGWVLERKPVTQVLRVGWFSDAAAVEGMLEAITELSCRGDFFGSQLSTIFPALRELTCGALDLSLFSGSLPALVKLSCSGLSGIEQLGATFPGLRELDYYEDLDISQLGGTLPALVKLVGGSLRLGRCSASFPALKELNIRERAYLEESSASFPVLTQLSCGCGEGPSGQLYFGRSRASFPALARIFCNRLHFEQYRGSFPALVEIECGQDEWQAEEGCEYGDVRLGQYSGSFPALADINCCQLDLGRYTGCFPALTSLIAVRGVGRRELDVVFPALRTLWLTSESVQLLQPPRLPPGITELGCHVSKQLKKLGLFGVERDLPEGLEAATRLEKLSLAVVPEADEEEGELSQHALFTLALLKLQQSLKKFGAENDEDVALEFALLACFFNITDERANALRRAVNHVLQHNPGLLDDAVLEELGLYNPRPLREASARGFSKPAAGLAQHGKPQPQREARLRLGKQAGSGSLPGGKNILEVLGFRHFYNLCTALAPEVAAGIDEEMPEVLFRLRQLEQPSLAWAQQGFSSTTPAAANGSGPGSHLPSSTDSSSNGADGTSSSPSAAAEAARWAEAMVLQPEWGNWLRRMRHALVLWAREQPLDPEDVKEAQEKRDARAKEQTGSSKAPKRGKGLRGTFTMDARTPDDLPVKHKVAVNVSGEGLAEFQQKAEDFYNKVAGWQEFQFGVQATTSYPQQLRDLLHRLGYPEGQHRGLLCTWAMRHAQAGTVSSFECTFPVPRQRASSADGGGSGSSEEAHSNTSSSGATTLATADQATSAGAGIGAPAQATAAAAAQGAAGAGAASSNVLAESNVGVEQGGRGFNGTGVDLRHLFLVLGALEAGTLVGEPLKGVWCPHSGPIRFRRSATDGKEQYDLRVYPTQQPHPPLELELSKRQFWALIDCLDAFRKAHPLFAQLLPPQPLEPAPQQQRWWPR
ncbi:hypothetical protein N2152v2_005352 [Parachlorella kessleri]